MKDKDKTKEQLINELTEMRQRVADLEESETNLKRLVTNEGNPESLRMASSIIDAMVEGLALGDTNGILTYVNEFFAEIHGYESAAELIGKSFFDLLPEHEIPHASKRFKEIIHSRSRIKNAEVMRIRKDGQTFPALLSLSPLCDHTGNVVGCIAAVRDITERKHAEDLYRTLTEKSFAGVHIVQDGVFRFLNSNAASYAGYAPEELTGTASIGIVHPEDREATKGYAADMLRGKRHSPYEFRIITRDGKVRWIMETVTPINYEGKPAVLGNSMDITEHKQAEEALRESRRRLSDVIEFLPDATLVIDRQGKVTAWNRAMEEMTGVKAEDMVGKGDYEYALPFYGIRRPILIDLVFISAEEIEKKYHFVKKERGVLLAEADVPLKGVPHALWGKAGPLYDSNGHIIGAIESIRDITERKQAEEELGKYKKHLEDLVEERTKALRESEARFRMVVENAPDAIFVQTEKRFAYVNESALKLFGATSEDQLLGQPVLSRIHPDYHAIVAERIRLLNEERKAVSSLEQKYLRLDCTPVDVEVSAVPITYEHHLAALVFVRDITERKRAEADKEKLEAQNRQIQKVESLGRMAGAIAHHFNNKLSAVMGNLDIALGKLPGGAEPIENLNAAMQATVKAAEVSRLMLTYLGQAPGTLETLDLSEACRRSLPMLRAAMPGKVVLETDLPSPGPVIRANANQIQQVLTNLITNAWEAFGESRGAIHLNVKTVSPVEIPASIRFPIGWQPQENAYACLEVTDAGCGIADKDIEKLFDPFFSSKFTGRGLGLSVVMGIVRAHSGAITVESEPGKGSAFRVYLPVSAEEVPRQLDKEAQAPEMQEGGTVLLVEDEEMVRNMAAAMLKSLGFAVIEAKDGVEAVEVFRQCRDEIRCVLCDLTMPRMNGWETLTALRKLASDVPVILASGYDKAQVMAGDHPEWPQAFLDKPYRIKELSNAISQALINRK